jgi:glycosyltransferase involved in cell wall biosynthesis
MSELGFTPYFFENTKDISVLLPTRGRREPLEKSVTSLIETASDPTKIEILLAFDNDDEETRNWFVQNVIPKLNKDVDIKMLTFNRLGYERLNEYLNGLVKYAVGNWMLFWNDDAWMVTPGWDKEIAKFNGKFRVLRMPTHNEHPYAIFPIVPKEWYRLFGYLSPHQINDAWISQIGYILNIVENIPVECVHDRYDLTGNNQDETYKQGGPGNMKEGNPNNPEDFNHINWTRKRHEDSDRIAWFMSEKGEDMSWYINVMNGKQDPWEYMLGPEQDPNNQVAIVR